MQDAEAARHAVPASTAQFRQALEQETLLSDTLAGELAATRSELDTKVALADKAVDEAAQLRRAAEVTAAELQKSLQQERERSAALASELAKARIDLEATVALPSKSHDEALQRSQAAEDGGGAAEVPSAGTGACRGTCERTFGEPPRHRNASCAIAKGRR